MNNSYLPRMNNVGYNQMMVLQEKNEYCKLMSKQIKKKRLKLEERLLEVYQKMLYTDRNFSREEKLHNLKLLKEYLNLLRIRKIVLLQI